jgi:hypothetical protein
VIRVEAVNGSGLNLTIPFAGPAGNGTEQGTIQFTNVGLRLYSLDYGALETVRIQNRTGELFHQYRFGDTLDREMVRPGTTIEVRGQDAKISMNGSPVITTGLVANVTTPDFQGAMKFNGGVLGLTTIAAAGYDQGSLYSRIQAIQAIAENEERMRLVSLSQGYSIQPPHTKSGSIQGLTVGTGSSAVPNSGELSFDFSQIDVTGMAPGVRAYLIAALNGGMTFTVTPGAVPETGLHLEASCYDATGAYVPGLLDFGEISFADLNSVNGYRVNLPGSAFDGLIIKGNQLSDSTGVVAPDNTFEIQGHVKEPSFSALLEVNTYATNARHATSETLENFIGGMQFQLGGNEGDQDRTVYSIQSMVMANVGRMEWDGKIYTLQDVLGSGKASLVRDPILAMRIIGKAVDDVTTLRARLGAFQKNMLEVNINSLTVSVENLTKTESAIRDTDMAAESTEYTKNQILVQAGTAMLAQANMINQSVLALLQG